MSKRKTLPEFNNYDQAAEWLDSHSTADLESTEVQFEIASPLQIQVIDSAKETKETIVLQNQLSQKIQRIARKEGISTRELLHKWLVEKIESSIES